MGYKTPLKSRESTFDCYRLHLFFFETHTFMYSVFFFFLYVTLVLTVRVDDMEITPITQMYAVLKTLT